MIDSKNNNDAMEDIKEQAVETEQTEQQQQSEEKGTETGAPKLNIEQQKELIVRGRRKQKIIVLAAIPIVAVLLIVVASMRGSVLVKNVDELVISNDSVTEAQILDLEEADAVYNGLDLEQSVFVREVVRLVNAERTAAGLAPLQLEQRLQAAAQTRSQEAIETLSHTRPDGSSYRTVILEEGISSGLTGENLGTGFETPEAFVEALKKSEDHKAYLLNAEYKYIGVGITPNPEDGRFKGFSCCQLFAR